MYTNYYTPAQLEALQERRSALGTDHIQQKEAEWEALIAEVRAEMEQGTSPASEVVQALLGRWQNLVQAFVCGDPAIEQSLHTLYQQETPEMASQDAVDSALFEYMKQALQAAPPSP